MKKWNLKAWLQKKQNRDVLIITGAILVVIFAIWGPERLAAYKDKSLLNQITVEPTEYESEGYRYSMNSNERVYLLSKCLDNQDVPESEFSAMTRLEPVGESVEDVVYDEVGTYAFVVNHQGPSDREITEEEIFDVCNREIRQLQELGVIPGEIRDVDADSYTAVLYSAIDVLEPRNNVAVWKVSLSTNVQNKDKAHRVIDVYIDADTGRIYEFYVRTEGKWADMDPGAMMQSYNDYVGLYNLEPYENANPLSESTSNVVKYTVPGMDDGTTVITLGYYEGINELFIKIRK